MSQLKTPSRSSHSRKRNGRRAGKIWDADRAASRTGFTLTPARASPGDLLEPRHRVRDDLLRGRARAGLGEHIDDDPLVDDLTRLAIGRRRPRHQLAGFEHLEIGLEPRLLVPFLVLVVSVEEWRMV